MVIWLMEMVVVHHAQSNPVIAALSVSVHPSVVMASRPQRNFATTGIRRTVMDAPLVAKQSNFGLARQHQHSPPLSVSLYAVILNWLVPNSVMTAMFLVLMDVVPSARRSPAGHVTRQVSHPNAHRYVVMVRLWAMKNVMMEMRIITTVAALSVRWRSGSIVSAALQHHPQFAMPSAVMVRRGAQRHVTMGMCSLVMDAAHSVLLRVDGLASVTQVTNLCVVPYVVTERSWAPKVATTEIWRILMGAVARVRWREGSRVLKTEAVLEQFVLRSVGTG